MASPTLRTLAGLCLAVVGGTALVACAPRSTVERETNDEASIAVLEEFFTHLEAGETAEAAALTDIDFPAEFIDEDFYAASAGVPSDLRIVETTGDDSYAVKATVEYALGDREHPATATYTVTNDDGDRRVGWDYSQYPLIMVGSPGRIVLNDTIEFPMTTDDPHQLILLPGDYEFAYVDPTGTTQLDPDGTNDFTLAFPVDQSAATDLPKDVNASSASLQIMAFIEPDLISAVEAEIDRLTAACVAEAMAGPSCPPAVLEYGKPLVDPSTVEWFENVDRKLEVTDGTVRYSIGFTVTADDTTYPVAAVYEGTVTRQEDGTVGYQRP